MFKRFEEFAIFRKNNNYKGLANCPGCYSLDGRIQVPENIQTKPGKYIGIAWDPEKNCISVKFKDQVFATRYAREIEGVRWITNTIEEINEKYHTYFLLESTLGVTIGEPHHSFFMSNEKAHIMHLCDSIVANLPKKKKLSSLFDTFQKKCLVGDMRKTTNENVYIRDDFWSNTACCFPGFYEIFWGILYEQKYSDAEACKLLTEYFYEDDI